MVINTVGNFDKAVIVSIFICRRSYRIGNLRIIVGCMICICLAIGPLFPCDSITRYISNIMAKRNRACFISCGLIANGRAIFDSYICTITCCQCMISICRATCNADGKSAIYRALQAANSYRGISKSTIHRTAENRSCFTMSFIHTATTQGCMGSKGIVIESTEYRGFVAKGIVVVAASYRRVLCGRCIGRATDNNSRRSVFISNIVCTTNDNRVLTKGTIRLFYYLSFFRLAFFDAASKNKSAPAFICY